MSCTCTSGSRRSRTRRASAGLWNTTCVDGLSAAARANPRAVDALARLSERSRVTLVPGNHDHQLATPEGGAALAAIGLRVERTRSVVRTVAGRTAVLQHGHEHDRGNADRTGG